MKNNWKWESYFDGSIGGESGNDEALINPHDYSNLLSIDDCWEELKKEFSDVDNFDDFVAAYKNAINNYKKNAGTYHAGAQA
jgi:hypothetical protein